MLNSSLFPLYIFAQKKRVIKCEENHMFKTINSLLNYHLYYEMCIYIYVQLAWNNIILLQLIIRSFILQQTPELSFLCFALTCLFTLKHINNNHTLYYATKQIGTRAPYTSNRNIDGEREIGLHLFLYEFWWLNCPTQINWTN
jgi:hypothetical protein